MTSYFIAFPLEGDCFFSPVILFEKSWEGSDWPQLDHMLTNRPVSFGRFASGWFTVIDSSLLEAHVGLVEVYLKREVVFSRKWRDAWPTV